MQAHALQVPTCRRLHSGRGPGLSQETECRALQKCVRGSATMVILPRGMGWSQDQGLEGQKPLPALPGHVQSHNAQAEALTMVSGSPVTRPGPQGGPGGGDHPEQVVGSETLLAFPWGADRMFAQTQSMAAVLAQVATGLLGSGPRGTRPWQGGLGLAGDCRWRHRTAGPAEGRGGHKCFCDSEMGRGRERDPTARPPLPCTSVLTRDMTVPPVKVRGPRDPV